MARIIEDGETLAVHCTDSDKWINQNPNIFFITDHHRNFPTVVLNLAKVKQKDLKDLLENAWK